MSSTTHKSTRSLRCSICNIKVNINYFECSCDTTKKFCSTHRFPFEHGCTKDHKNENKLKLEKEIVQVKSKKVEAF